MNLWQSIIPESLEFPQRLLVLLVIPLLAGAYILLSRRRNRKGMRFSNTALLQIAMPGASRWRRHLAVAMALLSLVLMAVAWAKPIGLDRERVERATVVVVLDVSQSMAATDVEPSRIDAAKTAAIDFVGTIPETYNVSLVTLSGNPSVVVPPTTNHASVNNAIDRLELRDATALGESIIVALNALGQAPAADNGEPPPGAIVILSDGGSTEGRPGIQAAQQAKADEVPIYTIAYGTANGYVELDGQREPVPVEDAELREVAEATGGEALEAGSAEQLADVYEQLSTEIGYELVQRDVTARYAMYAAVFALLAALSTISLSARWPS
ncbi:VWA domain-containing protein [Naumannella halotolerans]|uniref:Ca-activated chloride channel family protein n=1 Tax=Naumannella halotolerans TaxID=993414 RepID=A0A4R7JAY9_9ACTN|nr:VWA domain-containing protein [Naumannella halotolerans]TDT33807.1 Ca-activated chloride channel family protein [Naumannella halotolerans]